MEEKRKINLIERYIGKGRRTSITAKNIAILMNVSERQVRQYIEDARISGVIIINKQDGKGYYLPDDKDKEYLQDLKQQRLQTLKRAQSLLAQVKHIEEELYRISGSHAKM